MLACGSAQVLIVSLKSYLSCLAFKKEKRKKSKPGRFLELLVHCFSEGRPSLVKLPGRAMFCFVFFVCFRLSDILLPFQSKKVKMKKKSKTVPYLVSVEGGVSILILIFSVFK